MAGHSSIGARPLHEILERAGEEIVVEPSRPLAQVRSPSGYAASSGGPRPADPTMVDSVVRSVGHDAESAARRFSGPQSSAPLAIRYTNESEDGDREDARSPTKPNAPSSR